MFLVVVSYATLGRLIHWIVDMRVLDSVVFNILQKVTTIHTAQLLIDRENRNFCEHLQLTLDQSRIQS